MLFRSAINNPPSIVRTESETDEYWRTQGFGPAVLPSNNEESNMSDYTISSDEDEEESQAGGGYSFLVENNISGNPEVMGYDDFKPPLFNHEIAIQNGGGFYPDFNQPNVGGQMVYSSYDDNNPPIFSQEGGKLLLDKKIKHITNFIVIDGNYKLPSYVLNDIN